MTQQRLPTAVSLLLGVMTAVFGAETLVMLILAWLLPPLGKWMEPLVDSTLLTLLVTPLFWRWLVVGDRERSRSEMELRHSNARLEDALTRANEFAREAETATRAKSDLLATISRSQAQLTQAQELAEAGSWEWNVVANTVVWSDETYRIFGFAPGGCTPSYDQYLACVHPDDRQLTVEWINSVLARKASARLDNRIVRPDGEVRAVHARADVVLDDSDRVVRVFGTIQDITERKQREDKLRLFHTLLNQSADAIFVADPVTGRITETNDSACLNLGYTREELLALCVPDIETTFSGMAEFARRVPQLLAGSTLRVEGRQRRKDGSIFPVEVSVSHVTGPEGNRLLAISRDIAERKQAEDALRQTEERYRGLVESAFDGTILHQDGVVIEVNVAYARMFGYTVDELVGAQVLKLAAPEVRDTVADILQHGHTAPYESVGLRKDGSRFATETSGKACTYRGRPARIAAVRDISGRKQAEEALRQTTAQYRLLFDENPLPMWVAAADTLRFLAVNDAAVRHYGYSREEFLTMTAFELRPAEDVARLREAQASLRVEPDFQQLGMWRHLKKDGTPIDVEVIIHSIDFAQQAANLVLIQDVTERKRAAEAEARLVTILEATPDLVGISDPEGPLVYLNRAGRTMLGIDEQADLTEYNLREFRDAANAHIVLTEGISTAMREGVWSGETEFVALDGHAIPVSQVILAHKAPNGTVAFLSTIARDITARKQAETEIQQAKDAAEAANRAKSEFLATMSHEIRTPMNGVIGAVGLLLDDELTPRQRELATIARSSADSLLVLINDILDISRIEAGRMPIEQAPFDLLTTVEDVGEMFAERAEEKGVELVMRYASGARRRFVGDAGRIRQVLVNLVGNAIKFSERGHVLVSVEEERSAERRPMAMLRFAIEDTGIGISPDAMNRLFERFEQVDASTTRRFGGTGLGLAICKRLVELMGGQIGVTSRVGEGSTFWFTLPLLMDASPAPAPAPMAADVTAARHAADAPIASPARPRFRGRVLVADDSATNQRVAQLALEGLGCSVELARNGAEALTLLQQRPYDLVFMDCEMPDVDGLEATREIRALEARLARGGSPPPHQHIPVVAMTAKVLAGDREKCLAAGMDDYLGKPVQLHALIEMLERWLPLEARPSAGEPSVQTPPQAERPDTPRAVAPSGALDRVVLERLRTLAQQTTPALFAQVLEAFRTDAATYLVALKHAAVRDDRVSLGRTAHALKGASLNVGATTMAHLSRQLETVEEAGGLAAVPSLLAQLESEFQRVQVAIERERDQEQTNENTHR